MSTAERPSRRTGFDYDADLRPIVEGRQSPPNFKEIDLAEGVGTIVACVGFREERGRIRQMGETFTTWARYFLKATQGGGLDGTGYVIWYHSKPGFGGVARMGEFAVCDHAVVGTSTPQEKQRGWHKAYCSKCGLDMTVDSSD